MSALVSPAESNGERLSTENTENTESKENRTKKVCDAGTGTKSAR
jgi:hypothetical protein